MPQSIDSKINHIERESRLGYVAGRVALELGGLCLAYLMISAGDSLLNDMTFKESIMTPLTYLKAGGYVGYASRLVGIVLPMG